MRKAKIVGLALMIVLSGFGGFLMVASNVGAFTTVSGNVSGVWDAAGSPYYVTGDITVPGGQKLEIDGSLGPVQVIFNGSCALNVDGSLYVNGTPINTVYFMSNQTTQSPGDWDRITVKAPAGTIHATHATISGATYGLRLGNDGNTVSNTEIYNCTTGVYIVDSDYNTLFDVLSHDNSNYGLWLAISSENNTIENCNISYNNAGIWASSGSHYVKILNTTASYNYGGGSETGIYILDSNFATIRNCTVNRNGAGIGISNSAWNLVEDCTVMDSHYAPSQRNIGTSKMSNTTIRNCHLESQELPGETGFWLRESVDNQIYNNTIVWCHYGIDLAYEDDRNTIANNTFTDCNTGMRASSYCDNNTLRDNIVTTSLYNGILLEGPSTANNWVINNTVSGTTDVNGNGVKIANSPHNNTVMGNTIRDNAGTGLSLVGTGVNEVRDNYVYHNNFFNNSRHAYDETGLNFWNATYSQSPLMGGNYWDNYTGLDEFSGPLQNVAGSDLIGDTPYTWIDGGTGAQDNYPLMEPYGGIPPESSVNATAAWYNAPATITANATDVGSGVSNVSLWCRFSADGTAWGAWTEFGLNDTGSWSWDFSFPGGDGYYEFYSIATDKAGYVESPPASADQACGYDATVPSSALGPIGSYMQGISPLTLNGTASDTTSGVASVTLWYRFSADNSTWGGWSQHSQSTGPNWTWSFNFPDGGGYYEFYLLATDNAGNTEAAPSGPDTACVYDDSAPESSVDPLPGNWLTTTPLTIHATASDVGSGILNVTLYYSYSVDNQTWGPWTVVDVDTTEPYYWTFGFAGGAGYYKFRTLAVDRSGKTETPPADADAYARFDNVAPISGMEQPARYWWSDASGLSINTTASDIGSGVADVTRWYRHSADNSTWGNWSQAAGENFPDGDGYYQFYTTATDNAGNAEAAPPAPDVVLAFDTDAPSISDPAAVVDSVNWTVMVTATVSDGMALDSVRLIYRTGNSSEVNVSMAQRAGGGYRAEISVPEGTQAVHYRIAALDMAGNWASTSEATLSIELVPDDNPSNMTLWIALILVVALVLALLLVMLLRRRPEKMVEQMDREDGFRDAQEVEEELDAEDEDYPGDEVLPDAPPEEKPVPEDA